MKRTVERWSNFKIEVFIYSNEEDVARIFLFYVNKIYNMFLNKVQQSLLYLFKPISSKFDIVVDCNLMLLKCFLT